MAKPRPKKKKQRDAKRDSRSNVIPLSRARKQRADKKAQESREGSQGLDAEKRELYEMVVHTMMRTLRCKDLYTFQHSTRVAYFSLALGREMGLSEVELFDLEVAAPLS